MTKAIYINSDRLPGTREIVTEIIRQSSGGGGYAGCWRPARAMAVKAIALNAAPDEHVWMTTAEFRDWLSANWLDRRGGVTTLREQLHMGPRRRDAILNGSPITLVEALACAHYGLRLPLPVEAEKPAAFADYFNRTFARPTYVAVALHLSAETLSHHMVGYRMVNGKKQPRLPHIDMIRALDWVDRVGPFSPYGNRLPIPAALNVEKF